MDLVKFVEDEFVARKDFPVFGAGDTVTVFFQITEGEKNSYAVLPWNRFTTQRYRFN